MSLIDDLANGVGISKIGGNEVRSGFSYKQEALKPIEKPKDYIDERLEKKRKEEEDKKFGITGLGKFSFNPLKGLQYLIDASKTKGVKEMEERKELTPENIVNKKREEEEQKISYSKDRSYELVSDINSKATVLKQIENQLAELPEYSADYTNKLKQYKQMKQGYESALGSYEKEQKIIYGLTKARELAEYDRGKVGSYFSDDNLRQVYKSNIIEPLKLNTNEDDKIDSETTTAAEKGLVAFFNMVNPVIEKKLQAGDIRKADEFYIGMDFQQKSKDYVNEVKRVAQENYTEILGDDGSIDGEKFNEVLMKDEKMQKVVEDISDWVRFEERGARERVWDEQYKTIVGDDIVGGFKSGNAFKSVKGAINLGFTALSEGRDNIAEQVKDWDRGMYFDLGIGALEVPIALPKTVINILKGTHSKGRNVDNLPPEVRELLLDTTNTKKGWDKVKLFIQDDPYRAVMLPITIAVMLKSGGTVGGGKAIGAINSLSRVKELQAINRSARVLGGIADIKNGLLFDTLIDSSTQEALPLFNLPLNFLGGMIGRAKRLGLVDNMMKDVLSTKGGTTKELETLNKYIPGFIEEDLKDTEKLYDKINGVLGTPEGREKLIKTMFNAPVNDAVKNIETVEGLELFVETQKNVDRIGTKMGDIFDNTYKQIADKVEQAKKVGANTTEGKAIMDSIKSDIIKVGESFSVENISKFYNKKIVNTMDTKLFNNIYENIKNITKDGNLAVSAAADILMGGVKTQEGLIKSMSKIDTNWGIKLAEGLEGNKLGSIIDNANETMAIYRGKDDLLGSAMDYALQENKIQSQLLKLTTEQQDDLKYIKRIQNSTGVEDMNLKGFDRKFTKNVALNKVVDTMVNIGSMLKKMGEKSKDWVKPLRNIMADTYDSFSSKNKKLLDDAGKIGGKEYFSEMAEDFIKSDFSKKQEILQKNKEKGMEFLNESLLDLNDGLLDSIDAMTAYGGKSRIEIITDMNLQDALDVSKGLPSIDDLKSLLPEGVEDFTSQQKALIRGISGNGVNRIPPLKEVTNNIVRGLTKGDKDIDIPVAFFSREGMWLLDNIFKDVRGGKEILANSFYSKIGTQRTALDLIGQFFVGGTFKTKIMIDGAEISFADAIKGVDMKLTGEMGSMGGGIVETQFAVLTKYFLYDTDSAKKFFAGYGGAIDELFSGNRDATKLGNVIMTKYGKESVGQGYVAFVEDIVLQLEKSGMSKTSIVDLIHPMIFNPHEYLLGVEKLSTDSLIPTVIDVLKFRHGKRLKFLEKTSDDWALLDKIDLSKSESEKFLNLGNTDKSQFIRNNNAQKVEKALLSYFDENIGSLPITKEYSDLYRYDIGGYFVVQPKAGYTSNMNNTLTSEILDEILKATGNMASDTKEKLLIEAGQKLRTITLNAEDGRFLVVDEMLQGFKKYMSDQGIEAPAVNSILDEFGEYVLEGKKLAGNRVYQQRFFDMINKTQKKEKKVVEQSIEEAVEIIEAKKKNIEDMVVIDKFAQEKYLRDDINSFDLLQDGGKSLREILFSMGKELGDEEVVSILKNLGVDNEAIVAFQKGNLLKVEDVQNAVMKLMSEGRVSFTEALGNKKFLSLMIDKLDEGAKAVKKGQVITLDKFGNEVIDTKGGMNWFFKSFASLHHLSKYDEQIRGMVDNITSRQKYSMRNASLPGITDEKINIKKYISTFKEGLEKRLKDNNISAEDYQKIIDEIVRREGSAYRNLKYSGTDEVKKEIYDYIGSYLDDITNFRGERMSSDITANFTKGLIGKIDVPGVYRKNAGNRLAGLWIYTTNKDIQTLGSKMSAKGKIGFFKNLTFGDAVKDLMFGGLFDRGTMKTISNTITRTAMNIMFGPQAILKAPQQIINNVLNARGKITGFGYSEDALQGLSEFIYKGEKLQMDRATTQSTMYGADEIGGWTKFWNGVDNTLARTNTMVIADNATKKIAKVGALTDALYNIAEVGGEEGVKMFVDRTNKMMDFMNKYGLDKQDFYHKERAFGILETLAEKNGEDFNKVLDEYNTYSTFFKGEYNEVALRARSSYWMFYASETIPELSSIRVVDNNRQFFALKKRAFSKFTEYGYGLYSEVGKYGFKGFVNKAIKGEIPLITQIAKEATEGLRISWAVDRATDGEIDVETSLKYMFIPLTVLMMTFGDAVEKGYYAFNNTYKAGKNADGVGKAELLGMSAMTAIGEGIAGLLGTSFLYNYIAIKPFISGYETAKETDSIQGGLEAVFKQIILKGFTKFMGSSYGGYQVDSSFDGSLLTNILESGLNLQSTTRKQQQNRISQLYSADYYKKGGALKYLSDWWHGLARNTLLTGYVSPDLGVTQKAIDQWAVDNKTYLFSDPFALEKDPEGTRMLWMNYDRVILESKITSNKEALAKLGIDKKDMVNMTDEQIFDFAMDNGLLSQKTAIFNDTIRALDGEIGVSKAVKDAYYETIPEEDRKELEQKAIDLYVKYTKEGKDFKATYLKDFIESATELGTTYTVAGYLTAMNQGVDKILKEKYAINESRIKFGKEGDEDEKDAYLTAGLTRNRENDMNYIRDSREFQYNLIEAVQPFIGRNKKIGMSLEKKMYENDLDRPTKSFTPRMQIINDTQRYKEAIEKEGYLSDEVMNVENMYLMGIFNNLKSATSEDYSLEDKKRVYSSINGLVQERVNVIDDKLKNKYQNIMAKMGVAYSLSPFIKELNMYDADGFKEVVDSLGNGFIAMVDSLTSANPNDVQTAFEQVSGINTHKEGGSGKADIAKKNAMDLIKANTEAVKLAKNLRASGYEISPVKANYSIQKMKLQDVELEEVKIELERLPAPKVELPKGANTKTEDLKVAMRTISRSTTKSYKPKKIKAIRSPKRL